MERILFIAPGRIGDAVLSTGVLGHLLGEVPDAAVTVAAGVASAPLFADVPRLERLIPLVKQPHGRHWLGLWRAVAYRRWQAVADFRGSALPWLVMARRRFTFKKSSRPMHKVAQLGEALHLPSPPAPRLWISDERRRAAAALLPSDRPVLAVGPTANWGGKQWPAERFVAVIERLSAPGGLLPGASVAVVGGPSERGAASPVLEAIPEERRIDLVGCGDLLTVAACLERCTVYLGNDSGPMHMAAAVGAPTLGLFGPSSEVHYGPWGELGASVRTPQSFEDLVYGPGFDHRSHKSLMTGLQVDTVIAALEMLLRKSGRLC